jgi:hypothetical protein
MEVTLVELINNNFLLFKNDLNLSNFVDYTPRKCFASARVARRG